MFLVQEVLENIDLLKLQSENISLSLVSVILHKSILIAQYNILKTICGYQVITHIVYEYSSDMARDKYNQSKYEHKY